MDIENVIWDIIISCENYANAATFLSVLPQMDIIHELDEYSSYLSETIQRYYYLWRDVPQFEDEIRTTLVLSQNEARKWHLGAVKDIFQLIKNANVFDEKSKSALRSILNSMNASLSWYP